MAQLSQNNINCFLVSQYAGNVIVYLELNSVKISFHTIWCGQKWLKILQLKWFERKKFYSFSKFKKNKMKINIKKRTMNDSASRHSQFVKRPCGN